jgi:hypothetical protein
LRKGTNPRERIAVPRARRVRREARAPEQEPDHEVGARCAADIEADGPDERRHAQRPQNDADGASEDPDRKREPTSSPDPQALAWASRNGTKREVDPAPHEHPRNQRVQERFRYVVRDERADDRSRDRGRRRPGNHTPIDAARASMRQPARARGRG